MKHGKMLIRRIVAPFAVALIVATSGMWALATPAQTAVGGPVILGGDDLTDHGSVDTGTGNLLEGWLYIQRALENIGPSVTRSGNDGSIAALGSNATDGDAGAAIGLAGAKVSRTVAYHEGATEIDAFFTALAAGSAKPAIVWIAGTGASNDLDGDEEAAITTHAAAIAAFVSSGGGLMSHGTYYGWLTALLPDATAVISGGSDDLSFTPDGLTDLPALSVSDINAGPWHNHFEGDLGGLKVLVRSSDVLDATDQDAAVIIGGSRVTFVAVPTTAPPVKSVPTPCIGGIVSSRCPSNPPVVNVTPAATATAPKATATTAPPPPPALTVAPPAGNVAGAILAPNTGSGPDGNGSPVAATLVSFAFLLAGVAALSGAVRFKRG